MALAGVSISVEQGEAISVIGPNGAGKTSLLRAVSGLVAYGGDVVYEGRSLKGLTPDRIVRAGIVHCPETGHLFGEMTVQENLELGAFAVRERGALAASLDRVFTLFPRLGERRRQRSATLSGGERQMAAIGRSLMAAPAVLMLDEPSLGLAPLIRDRIEESIRQVHAEWRVAVILVEQDTTFALDLAERVYVLDSGSVVRHGPVAEVAGDPVIRETYLGLR